MNYEILSDPLNIPTKPKAKEYFRTDGIRYQSLQYGIIFCTY